MAASSAIDSGVTTHTDQSLIDAARSGDVAAMEELLARYQPRIYRFTMKMCRTPEDAQDVLQETMLTMARKLDTFRGESSVSTWLYSIARSFCIKKARKSKYAPTHIQSLTDEEGKARQIPDRRRGPEEEVLGHELQAALEDAIGALDPKYREVLMLRDVEGLSAKEVAEILNISVAAVKSRLHRARLAVRDALAPVLAFEAPAALPAHPPARAKKCPDVAKLFSQHLEGDIDADLCAQMEQHLEDCPRCKVTCDSLKESLAVCRAAPQPTVPDAVQAAVRSELRAHFG